MEEALRTGWVDSHLTMGSNVQKERLGIAAVAMRVAGAEWFFREQPLPDEGVDAQIEGADAKGRPNGRLLGVQVKSGPSYFKNPTKGGWRYKIKPNNLAYWRKYSLPVVVVLYDEAADRAYWQAVRSEHYRPTADEGAMLFVPEEQIFDRSAIPALERLANEGLPKEIAALAAVLDRRRADLDVGWMELLASGKRVFLEAEEWVNKSSGRSSLRLIVEDARRIERIEREWPWVFLAGASYADELGKMFPWADLHVDEQRFRDEAYAEFVNECGIWDSEDGEYRFTEDFDDWVERRLASGLRPYGEAGGGEVALWRLELTLNDLGRQTLTQELDDLYWDSLFKSDAEEREAAAVKEGYYEGSYGDGPMGRSVERVEFVFGDESEIVAGDEVLWTETKARPALARSILSHALQREPTDAQTDAFVARFKDVFDDPKGQGWTISHREVESWLHELGARR